MLSGYWTLIPYGLLLAAAAWSLFADLLPGRDKGAALFSSVMAVAAAAGFTLSHVGEAVFANKLLLTTEARLASVAIALLAAIWFLWTASYGQGRTREAVALGAFSALGATLLVSSFDLIVMLLALELTSMPAYVLIGYRRYRIEGLEGAIKYFLLSVLTTLVMTYGISFLYGMSGTSNFASINVTNAGTLGLVAALLVYVGLFAKLSAAPFHYWAPDAYAGAEPWTVAFVSTVPKLAGLVMAVRITAMLIGQVKSLSTVLLAVAVLSLALGSFAALTQKDVRRMMAYSGVVNIGYMLIAASMIASVGSFAIYTPVFYAVVYAVATMGVMLILAQEGDQVSDLAGLSKRKPVNAWFLAVFAMSLIGIPPLAGFFGKFYLFLAGVAGKQYIIVGIATAAAVVSAFYYLRMVKAAFFDTVEELEVTEDQDASFELDPTATAVAFTGEIEEAMVAAQVEEAVAPRAVTGQFALGMCVFILVIIGPLSGVILEWMTHPAW